MPIHQAPFRRLALMFAREQRGLANPQAVDDRGGRDRHPQ
jgi:hypothetical protein